jgi:hypothetical protein
MNQNSRMTAKLLLGEARTVCGISGMKVLEIAGRVHRSSTPQTLAQWLSNSLLNYRCRFKSDMSKSRISAPVNRKQSTSGSPEHLRPKANGVCVKSKLTRLIPSKVEKCTQKKLTAIAEASDTQIATVSDTNRKIGGYGTTERVHPSRHSR